MMPREARSAGEAKSVDLWLCLVLSAPRRPPPASLPALLLPDRVPPTHQKNNDDDAMAMKRVSGRAWKGGRSGAAAVA